MYLRLLELNPSLPGELHLKIVGEAVDDLRSPTLASLPDEDVAADRPVEQNQFPVDRERRPDLCAADAGLELLEKLRVAGRCLESRFHRFEGSTASRPGNWAYRGLGAGSKRHSKARASQGSEQLLKSEKLLG